MRQFLVPAVVETLEMWTQELRGQSQLEVIFNLTQMAFKAVAAPVEFWRCSTRDPFQALDESSPVRCGVCAWLADTEKHLAASLVAWSSLH